eukprot:scaffold5381_cov71-Skeletonema_marinoi.AAC.1
MPRKVITYPTTKLTMKKSGLLLLASCSSSSAFQQVVNSNRLQNGNVPLSGNRIPQAVRYMQPSSIEISDDVKGRSRRLGNQAEKSFKSSSGDKRVPRTELLAATLDSVEDIDNTVASLLGRFEIPTPRPNTVEAATKVLSASLLITGNTVGSSMFVLPDAVGGVGLMNGSALFIDVAIKLHETSECEVPASFKDFADAAMKSEAA